MLTRAEIDGMRSTTSANLPDTITVTRRNAPAFDAGTGTITDTPTEVYTGSGRIAPAGAAQEDLFGGDLVTASPFRLFVPHDAPTLELEDVVTVSVSNDQDLSARRFRVTAIGARSHHLVRVAAIEELDYAG